MEIELRRYQNYLQCSGFAVILFSVWGTIKGFAFFISNWGEWLLAQSEELQQLLNMVFARVIFILFIVIGTFITVMIHYWIGRGAISESRGIRLKRPYVTGAVLLAVLTAAGILLTRFTDFNYDEGDAMKVNSTIIDLSLLIALCEMILAAWKVRKLTQQLEQKEA